MQGVFFTGPPLKMTKGLSVSLHQVNPIKKVLSFRISLGSGTLSEMNPIAIASAERRFDTISILVPTVV